jgi:hypothetical protein
MKTSAFGRLEAGDRRDPLARVLLAVDEDADLGAVALLPIRSIFTWNGARWTCAGALRKSDRRERGVAWETPLPGIAKPR